MESLQLANMNSELEEVMIRLFSKRLGSAC